MRWMFITCFLWPLSLEAETFEAARTLRSQTIISQSDLRRSETASVDGFTNIDQLVGLETKVIIYAGRPITAADVGPAAVIERNQIVLLKFNNGVLSITAEARALGRAGIGDRVRVMNLASRSTVSGRVNSAGEVEVNGLQN